MTASPFHPSVTEALGIELGPVKLGDEQSAKVREGVAALRQGQVHLAHEVHEEMKKLVHEGG